MRENLVSVECCYNNCSKFDDERCIYSKFNKDSEYCIYYDFGDCTSAMAQANALTLKLKELVGEQ